MPDDNTRPPPQLGPEHFQEAILRAHDLGDGRHLSPDPGEVARKASLYALIAPGILGALSDAGIILPSHPTQLARLVITLVAAVPVAP